MNNIKIYGLDNDVINTSQNIDRISDREHGGIYMVRKGVEMTESDPNYYLPFVGWAVLIMFADGVNVTTVQRGAVQILIGIGVGDIWWRRRTHSTQNIGWSDWVQII